MSGSVSAYNNFLPVLLASLFRFWGKQFPVENRERLLKGASGDWPRDPYALTDVADWEREWLSVSEDELAAAIDELDRTEETRQKLDALLEMCREIAEPFTRSRDEQFADVEKRLT